ncbi:MAG TPA: polysaccharide biosynthesis tyrosine autokinase [Chryseolinea sp.]
MLETQKNILPHPSQTNEAIDFNKLKIIFKRNWLWLVILFLVINSVAYLKVRYTKNIYESSSELKLDIKKEATEFGIKPTVEDPNFNLLSGEIELIESRLFLGRVLDSSDLNVSYFSVGRVLNDELFQNAPFEVRYKAQNESSFNAPIHLEDNGSDEFSLQVGDEGQKTAGRYNSKVSLNGVDLYIEKNEAFKKGDEIGYFFVLNTRDALLGYLLRNLTAEPLNYNANTLRISFKDNNPSKATAILNKIDSIYLHYSYEQKNLANKQKIDWVSNELVNIEHKMEDFENYFENFTLQNKTNNLDDDLKKTVSGINRLDSQRYELTNKIVEVNTLMEGMKTGDLFISLTQLHSLPPTVAKNLEQLEDLYRDQEKLKLSYNEATFAYRQRQKDIETLRAKASRQLEEQRAEWIKRLDQVNQKKARLEHEFVNIPDKSTQFSKNLRFYKLYEQFYLSLMQSKSQFEITQAGSVPDYKILSPANLSYTPISPNKLMITGIGFVGSFVAMLLLVGVLYVLNNKITSLLDIERVTSVPMLGVVPSSRQFTKNGLHVLDHPKSMVSEAIRTLRTNLDFFNVNGQRKVIAVSSTVSGEGKSFIALNLGAVMALSKKKVVLLDLDMRKPKQNLPVNVEDTTKGISTVLIRKNTWQECVSTTALSNFDYIPSGPHPPNPSELLLNGEFEDLLSDLKTHYDYIILDTPPVGLVTDGIMAMKRADISIYIFRANYSKKDFVLNLQRIININKFSNITTLLNALPSTGEQSYGYGYYEEPGNRPWLKKIFNT